MFRNNIILIGSLFALVGVVVGGWGIVQKKAIEKQLSDSVARESELQKSMEDLKVQLTQLEKWKTEDPSLITIDTAYKYENQVSEISGDVRDEVCFFSMKSVEKSIEEGKFLCFRDEEVKKLFLPSGSEGSARIVVKDYISNESAPELGDSATFVRLIEKREYHSDTYFTYGVTRIGDTIGGMKVESIGRVNDDLPISLDNLDIVLLGELVVRGKFECEEGVGPYQTFTVDKSASVPKIIGDRRDPQWFGFSNENVPISCGKTTSITIDRYRMRSYPSEVFDEARFVKEN